MFQFRSLHRNSQSKDNTEGEFNNIIKSWWCTLLVFLFSFFLFTRNFSWDKFSTSRSKGDELVLVCVSVAVKLRMYQHKVDVNMLNAVKSFWFDEGITLETSANYTSRIPHTDELTQGWYWLQFSYNLLLGSRNNILAQKLCIHRSSFWGWWWSLCSFYIFQSTKCSWNRYPLADVQ